MLLYDIWVTHPLGTRGHCPQWIIPYTMPTWQTITCYHEAWQSSWHCPSLFYIIPCLVLIAPIMHCSGSDESPYLSPHPRTQWYVHITTNSWAELGLTWGIVSRLFVCFLVSESVLMEKASSFTHHLLLLWFSLQVFLENCQWLILTDCAYLISYSSLVMLYRAAY